MDIFVYDTNFKMIDIVDLFESFIWTDRYTEPGDFELYTSAGSKLRETIKEDYYLSINNSDRTMIVESFKIEKDEDGERKLCITGRSLESIIYRRIIWGSKTVSGKLQDVVKVLLTEAIINPSDANRKISNFIFEESTDPAVTEITIDAAEYKGDNLGEVIKTLCETKNIGYKITLNDQNQFVFKLYAGADRSHKQNTNPYVVFSPNFDNLKTNTYEFSKEDYKNVCLVCGKDDALGSYGSVSGLDRRESYTSDSDATTAAQLSQAGEEYLNDYKVKRQLEGEAEMISMYKINEDFFIGDLVQVRNEDGIEPRARVSEVITSVSTSEDTTYPTFKLDEKEEATDAS